MEASYLATDHQRHGGTEEQVSGTPDEALARGSTELRAALEQFTALKPTLRTQAQSVVAFADIALYIGRWTLRGTDPSGQAIAMGGESSDILRKQPDGRGSIAIDNPWGAQMLQSH